MPLWFVHFSAVVTYKKSRCRLISVLFASHICDLNLYHLPMEISGNSTRNFWSNGEGCPIHPTRVDSSLVFAIRQTGNRFVNPIPSNRHESFPLLSIRRAGSPFSRDLENVVDLDFEGGLKMLSIRVDSIESTEVYGHVLRTRKVHVSLFHGS